MFKYGKEKKFLGYRHQNKIYYDNDNTNSYFTKFDDEIDTLQKQQLIENNNISKIYLKILKVYDINYLKKNINYFKNEYQNNYNKLYKILIDEGLPIEIYDKFLKKKIDYATFLFMNEFEFKQELKFTIGICITLRKLIKLNENDMIKIYNRIKKF